MPETKILVVVKGEEARSAYEEALGRIGAGYVVAGTFAEALALAIETPFNGVVIDILTLVRSDKDEKIIAYDCMNLYPSIRVKWDGRKKEINLSLLEQSFVTDTASTLRYFVEGRCRNFPSRSLRRHHRTSICLCLLLGTTPSLDEGSVKTFTVNLSPGGVFVHTTLPLTKGDQVWLRFCELSDPAPIRASVRWSIAWGAGRGIPGAGLAFEELTEHQAREIAALAG